MKLIHVILDAKYEKAFMETKCQHFTNTQCNDLLKLLQKIEEFSDGTLGT